MWFTDLDAHLLGEGTHYELHRRLGAHAVERDGRPGVIFAVWAPDARRVRVAGDFEHWRGGVELRPVQRSGVWEAFVPGARPGHRYKFRVTTRRGAELEKADPFAAACELPPGNASIVDASTFEWQDTAWLAQRHDVQRAGAPLAVYEVHLGSWRRDPGDPGRLLAYRELAPLLADHCLDLGFTHVELLPVMEHPFYGSWGYQVTGFFAPTGRYGAPDDLRYLIDHLHQRGVGVLLDWVPAHFPDDPHGLARFDGTALYEHEDPREGRHPDWGSLIFNYGRHEVRAFLISSACFWLDEFHADGLRVDAVASMLYRDYSRAPGEWVPNRYGGRENLEALDFLRRCADEIRRRCPGALFVAEESTSWPQVTAPTTDGGLGFTHKWDMGWMHDTLRYLARDPIHRRHHQDDITFRGLYQHRERFMLPLSHDEVVHGKGSLLAKMPGDEWQQCANLRLLLALQCGMPGTPLLFMGGEFGQRREWNHETSLDWHLAGEPAHTGITAWLRALLAAVREQPALHALDDDPRGFEWIDCTDAQNSVFVWCRRAVDDRATLVFALNATPVPRPGYRVGLPHTGGWRLVLNSDDARFDGSGHDLVDVVEADEVPWHGQAGSALVTLPPLACVAYGRVR
jgi:1,4-alpha-glucan branching enzyme